MGIRLTGISTPFGGASWEYGDDKKQNSHFVLSPGEKVKVFISSICGKPKYDKVRAELKEAIEATQLATVYLFEGTGASTLPAGAHYTSALEDSDICIFLIDNKDGITPGVQVEIDTVAKYKIKALYYFCDENSKEKTPLEQSLLGAQFSKSKTVHSFDELSKDGAQALIDDIATIYRYYCAGKLILKPVAKEEVQSLDVVGIEKKQALIIPKTTLKNVDKCRDYLLQFMLGYPRGKYPDETEKTSEFDEWGLQFLPILFEGISIKRFNVSMFLETLKSQQEDAYFQVVQLRWQAIQSYFSDDIEACMDKLNAALILAKETNQPTWFIKDILIDVRNQHWTQCTVRNAFSDSNAQNELIKSDEELYYPILDRINQSLQEKYIEGLYKEKTKSPHTVTYGNNLDEYGEMLAGLLVISMYNGSLTHILLLYEKIRECIFYFTCKYDDWNFKILLYKLAIFAGKEKDIKGIRDSYSDISNKLSPDEALSIMKFCQNHPIKYRRFSSQLLAFGSVAYFLNDTDYAHYEKVILEEIKIWIKSDVLIANVGYDIFRCLMGAAYRMKQDDLSELCCLFIDRHYSRWYTDMFKLIANRIDINKMSNKASKNLIDHISKILENSKEIEQIKYSPYFLCVLRNQNKTLTESLDKNVEKYLPKFYFGNYKLETTENEKDDMPVFIEEYIERIKKNNETQGKGGIYFGHGVREIATVRAILLGKNVEYGIDTMDMLINTIANTLLTSSEGISTKLDAIMLLICILLKYPEHYMRNNEVYEKIFEHKEDIENKKHSIISSNIDTISLKIGLQFLYAAMGKDVYSNILELMPLIQDDIATTIAVTNVLIAYLETTNSVTFPTKVETIVFQNILLWLQSEHIDIKWNATRLFLMMYRNPENRSIINRQLIKIVDENGPYIKNIIMRQIYEMSEVEVGIKEYITSKCRNDANYVVRMVCAEIEEANQAVL